MILIDKLAEGVKFNVFPNPIIGMLNIDVQFKKVEDTNISIFNAIGQRMMHWTFQTQQLNKTFDVSALPQGLYHIRLQTPDGILTRVLTILQ